MVPYVVVPAVRAFVHINKFSLFPFYITCSSFRTPFREEPLFLVATPVSLTGNIFGCFKLRHFGKTTFFFRAPLQVLSPSRFFQIRQLYHHSLPACPTFITSVLFVERAAPIAVCVFRFLLLSIL